MGGFGNENILGLSRSEWVLAIDVSVGLDSTATAVDLPRKGGGPDVGTARGDVDRLGVAVAILAAPEVDIGRVGHGGDAEAHSEDLTTPWSREYGPT
ncbi:hypothetical protein PG984_003702 [Apiospora sp. TS-2023a]